MRLAFLSDIHLNLGRLNRYMGEPGQLMAQLDLIEARADRVVVLGDLADLYRPRRPGGGLALLEALRRWQPALLERLLSYELVFGNHDRPLRHLGAPGQRIWVADGLRVLAHHGHRFDPPMKKIPGLPETANYVAGWLERLALRRVARWMGDVPVAVDRRQRARRGQEAAGDRALVGAASLMARGFDVVVQGHNHRLRLVPHDRGLLINTGAVFRGLDEWALLDTEAGEASVWRQGAPLAYCSWRGPQQGWIRHDDKEIEMNETTQLNVRGMTCGGCVRSVNTIITRKLGLDRSEVAVDLDSGRATIKASVEGDRLTELLSALDAQGFPSALAS